MVFLFDRRRATRPDATEGSAFRQLAEINADCLAIDPGYGNIHGDDTVVFASVDTGRRVGADDLAAPDAG